MTIDPRTHDLRTLWQQQALDEMRAISLEDVRRRARALEQKLRRMDAIMYVSGVVNVAAFAAVMWFLPGLRIVAAIVILTALVIVSQYHRRRPLRAAEADRTTSACLDYYRAALLRKRDLSRTLGRWFLPPAILGQVALMVGFLIAPPGVPRRWIWIALPFWVLFDVVVFVGAWRRHRQAAAHAQRQLDDLDEMAGPS
jgi:hypothetical protein